MSVPAGTVPELPIGSRQLGNVPRDAVLEGFAI